MTQNSSLDFPSEVARRAGTRSPRRAWMAGISCVSLTTGFLWLRQPTLTSIEPQLLEIDARPSIAVINGTHSVRIDKDVIEPIEGDPDEANRHLAWLTGELRFKGEPLEEAVDEFNRYNLERLRIADPRIRALPVYGTYRARDPEDFARRVRQALGVRFEVRTGSRGSRMIDLKGEG
jgi:hypothetical protein